MNRRGFFQSLGALVGAAVVAPAATLQKIVRDPRSILPSGRTHWVNYTATYTNVDKAELMRRIKQACRKTQWRAPGEPGAKTIYCPASWQQEGLL